jgi:alkaline phosphatase D
MLGAEQLQWFQDHLQQSKASWKIIGNQVLFSPLNIEGLYRKNMPKNLDAWDGYPAEQKHIELFLLENKISNVVFVSGDTHAAWAIEIPNTTGKFASQKSIAIELGTTSVSSGNGNERTPDAEVLEKEHMLRKMNPHVKYLNNRDHGYLLLTLSTANAKAQWFTVKTLRQRDSEETLNKKFTVASGTTRLE